MNGSIETAFVGRVAHEPELKTSQAGKSWLAVNTSVGQGDDIQWLRIAVFGETAERLAGHLHKGDNLYCEGTLTLRSWTDKEGRERTGLNVAVSKAEKVGASVIGRNKPAKPRERTEGGQPPPRSDADSAARRETQRPLDDTIPF